MSASTNDYNETTMTTSDLPSTEIHESSGNRGSNDKKKNENKKDENHLNVVMPQEKQLATTTHNNEKGIEPKSPSPKRWWDVLVRSIGFEQRLALKSTVTVATLITAILYMMYKYYWRSARVSVGNGNNKQKKTSNSGLLTFPLGWTLWWIRQNRSSSNETTNRNNTNTLSLPWGSSSTQVVPLSVFLQAAKAGSVDRALFRASQIWFQTKNDAKDNPTTRTAMWKTAHLPPPNQYNSQQLQADILDLLQRSGATISALPDSIWQKLATPALAALPFVYLALLYRMMHKLQNGDHDNMKSISSTNSSARSHRTTFADVAGLDHVLTEVSEIVQYLRHPAAYHGVGARPPRAVLMHGPPGSGKTLLARAVAGEAQTLFYACSASEFVETYVGRGAARVRSVFRKARSEASKMLKKKKVSQLQLQQGQSNCTDSNDSATAILFIDELDALAKTRSSGLMPSSNDERDQTLNQLLTEMDGFYHHENGHNDDDNVTLIVIAATNRADVLDPAILRRFDRQVHVGYPDAKGREAILLVHAKKIKFHEDSSCSCNDGDEGSTTTIRWDYLASDEMTSHFSGADLRNVINEAALLAVREQSTSVHEKHLILAVQRIRDMKQHLQQHQQPIVQHFQMRKPFVSPFSLDEFH